MEKIKARVKNKKFWGASLLLAFVSITQLLSKNYLLAFVFFVNAVTFFTMSLKENNNKE